MNYSSENLSEEFCMDFMKLKSIMKQKNESGYDTCNDEFEDANYSHFNPHPHFPPPFMSGLHHFSQTHFHMGYNGFTPPITMHNFSSQGGNQSRRRPCEGPPTGFHPPTCYMMPAHHGFPHAFPFPFMHHHSYFEDMKNRRNTHSDRKDKDQTESENNEGMDDVGENSAGTKSTEDNQNLYDDMFRGYPYNNSWNPWFMGPRKFQKRFRRSMYGQKRKHQRARKCNRGRNMAQEGIQTEETKEMNKPDQQEMTNILRQMLNNLELINDEESSMNTEIQNEDVNGD